ncbi:hypothetical protein EVAR_85374_1 [Eumeta japonica]|uniref:Uncharacterized protein n=1 Tax=Eumeta variegata TaxID=151549 RepID=A0A4C1WS31_EUMVA|nr:hypothetical protein EVAR_85374_1 [Eumeta japonica]
MLNLHKDEFYMARGASSDMRIRSLLNLTEDYHQIVSNRASGNCIRALQWRVDGSVTSAESADAVGERSGELVEFTGKRRNEQNSNKTAEKPSAHIYDQEALSACKAVTVRHEYSIRFQEAGNALVTPLGLRVSMNGGGHLASDGAPARLPQEDAI